MAFPCLAAIDLGNRELIKGPNRTTIRNKYKLLKKAPLTTSVFVVIIVEVKALVLKWLLISLNYMVIK